MRDKIFIDDVRASMSPMEMLTSLAAVIVAVHKFGYAEDAAMLERSFEHLQHRVIRVVRTVNQEK